MGGAGQSRDLETQQAGIVEEGRVSAALLIMSAMAITPNCALYAKASTSI
eukprot:gene36851-45463_t